MRPIALIDTGVVGLLSVPSAGVAYRGCASWLARARREGIEVKVPLICYYEARREMARLAGDTRLDKVERERWEETLVWLDDFSSRLGIAGIDVKVMRLATDIWAEARRRGAPTAARHSLDADVILAAIARWAARGGRDVRIVTTNVGHLSRFVPACRWEDYPFE